MTAPLTQHALRKLTIQQRWWHEALADYLTANPTATNKECADYLGNGRSEGTISLIRNTDTFKALLGARRQELRDTMDAAITSKLTGIAYTAFDAILNRLEKKRDTLPMNELTNVVDTISKFTGAGKQGGVTVNVNNQPQVVNVPVSVSELQEAQAALRRHQASLATAPPVIPQPVVEVVQETEKVEQAQIVDDDTK